MKYIIDTDICEKNNITLAELFASLLIKTSNNTDEIFKNLVEKNAIITTKIDGDYLLDFWWNDLIDTVLLDSDKSVPKSNDVTELAQKLRDIYPEGKKEGTNKYWRGNTKEIVDRLRKFYKLYSNKYDDNTIIEATKKYVESFNGNYSYMRVLKYFIWKCDKKIDAEGKGYIEEVSDLADYIENKGQERNDNWMVTLK